MEKNIYSLDCSIFTETFNSINELIDFVKISGSDPNYEITKNGVSTGELMSDLIIY